MVRIVAPPGAPQAKTPRLRQDRDRRAHRREHALAGRHRVRFALDEPVHVRLAGARREVVHLVVPEKAEAGRDARVAEGVVQRRRHRDDHAVAVDDREVGRRRLLREHGPDAGRGRRLLRVDRGHEAPGAIGIQEGPFAHTLEGGIAEKLVAVPERALLDLGEPVHAVGALRTDPAGLRARRPPPSRRGPGPTTAPAS